MAYKYRMELPYPSCRRAAMRGLLDAILSFDVDRNVRLITHARAHIEKQIRLERNANDDMPIPPKARAWLCKVKLHLLPGASDIDVAEAIDICQVPEYYRPIVAYLVHGVVRLSATDNGIDVAAADLDEEDGETWLGLVGGSLLDRAIDSCSEREATILRSYFGIGVEARSLQQVAGELGVTRECVRVLRNTGLQKVKAYLLQYGSDDLRFLATP
jgi:DNA-directed RNA polymerase specialized sigma subunit